MAKLSERTLYKYLDKLGSKQNEKQKKPKPILIVPSIINQSYILDLLPEKSFVSHLLESGFEVYILEWGLKDLTTAESCADPYQAFIETLDYFINEILLIESVDKIHLWGHCLGGSLGLIFSNFRPNVIQSLGLLNTPVDFSKSKKLNIWTDPNIFNIEAFLDYSGSVGRAHQQLAFQAMKPMAWFHKIVRFSQKINDPRFLRLFFALEKWSLDGHDIPSSWYKFVIDELYQKNAILNQSVFEDRIKLKIENLSFPIFEFYSVDDHIVPDGSGVPWLWKKQGLTVKTMPVKGGHVGSLISDYSKKNYWPQMTKWLMEQSA